MANYLCPNSHLTVQDQRNIFQIRSMTNPLSSNRGDPKPCSTGCEEILENLTYFPLSSIKPRSSRKYRTFIKWNIERNKNSIEPMAEEHEENLYSDGFNGFSIDYIVNPMIPHDSINTHHGK